MLRTVFPGGAMLEDTPLFEVKGSERNIMLTGRILFDLEAMDN